MDHFQPWNLLQKWCNHMYYNCYAFRNTMILFRQDTVHIIRISIAGSRAPLQVNDLSSEIYIYIWKTSLFDIQYVMNDNCFINHFDDKRDKIIKACTEANVNKCMFCIFPVICKLYMYLCIYNLHMIYHCMNCSVPVQPLCTKLYSGAAVAGEILLWGKHAHIPITRDQLQHSSIYNIY